ncbi:hypothetical protein NN561_004797 [Cricetulus griseus]
MGVEASSGQGFARVAERGGALETGWELHEGRGRKRPPWASRVAARTADSGERCGSAAGHHGRGESPSPVLTRSPTHSEDRQSGVKRRPMEDKRWGVPLRAAHSHAHTDMALGAYMRPPACHPSREKNESSKIEEAKSTSFQPSPEMSCSPVTFFLFPKVKTKATNQPLLPAT